VGFPTAANIEREAIILRMDRQSLAMAPGSFDSYDLTVRSKALIAMSLKHTHYMVADFMVHKEASPLLWTDFGLE
jgi:hypothetical protein